MVRTAVRSAGLALLSVIPAILFTLDRGESAVWLAVLSIVLIAGCVYVLLGGTQQSTRSTASG